MKNELSRGDTVMILPRVKYRYTASNHKHKTGTVFKESEVDNNAYIIDIPNRFNTKYDRSELVLVKSVVKSTEK